MPDYRGYTVAEILRKFKRGSIKQVPLPAGSPSWDDIMDLKWEEVLRRARSRMKGFRIFKKLLLQPRFDK